MKKLIALIIGYFLLVIGYFLFWGLIIGGLIYVAIHFIVKYW